MKSWAAPQNGRPRIPSLDWSRRQKQLAFPRAKKRWATTWQVFKKLLMYGLKGTAAYADHAQILGQEDPSVYAFFHEMLDYLVTATPEVGELVANNMRCGEVNLKVMGLLDAANTGAYGNPAPTKVRVEPVKGKAIVVSGHDLKDLAALLEQTEGTDINIYTHGEMLPAHGYPELKKHKHLVGILRRCMAGPGEGIRRLSRRHSHDHKLYPEAARDLSGPHFYIRSCRMAGVRHIADQDFSPVIKAALAAPGF